MIECQFRCSCMRDWGRFYVRVREQDEDLLDWMNVVRSGLGDAHLTISPLCTSTVADLKIPIDETADGVGLRAIKR